MLREQPFDLVSNGLRLEARLRQGDGRLAALVLHPHPLYGGDMDNHVVLGACGALAEAGATTLRFNFRGAGLSEGAHDNGKGESLDARAALAALRAHTSDAPVVLVGYSFGAIVAASVATETGVAALALISPPLGMAVIPLPPEGIPTLVIAGDRDPVSPEERVLALASDRVRVVTVPGVDHGWWPGMDALKVELLALERRITL